MIISKPIEKIQFLTLKDFFVSFNNLIIFTDLRHPVIICKTQKNGLTHIKITSIFILLNIKTKRRFHVGLNHYNFKSF